MGVPFNQSIFAFNAKCGCKMVEDVFRRVSVVVVRIYVGNDRLSQHLRVKKAAIDLDYGLSQAFDKPGIIVLWLN